MRGRIRFRVKAFVKFVITAYLIIFSFLALLQVIAWLR